MNNKKNVETLFDDMIKCAADSAVDEMYDNLSKKDNEHIFSQQHNDKMECMFSKHRKHKNAKKILKYAERVACVILVFFITGGITLFSVDAWRTKFIDFIYDKKSSNTDIAVVDTQKTYSDSYVTMNYIPLGYELYEQQVLNLAKTYTFKYKDNEFTLLIKDISVKTNIDTENADVSNVRINDSEGIYVSNDNSNSLFWHDNFNTYVISGNIGKKEIIKIANNLSVK